MSCLSRVDGMVLMGLLVVGVWLLNLWIWRRERITARLLQRARALGAETERALELLTTAHERMAAELTRLETESADALTAGLLDDGALGGRAVAALAEADDPMSLEELATELETSVEALGIALAKLYRGGAITLSTTPTVTVTSLLPSPRGREAVDQVARLTRAQMTGQADA